MARLRSSRRALAFIATLIAAVAFASLHSFARLSHSDSDDPLVRFRHKLPLALRQQVALRAPNPGIDSQMPVIVRVSPDFFAEQEALGNIRQNALKTN